MERHNGKIGFSNPRTGFLQESAEAAKEYQTGTATIGDTRLPSHGRGTDLTSFTKPESRGGIGSSSASFAPSCKKISRVARIISSPVRGIGAAVVSLRRRLEAFARGMKAMLRRRELLTVSLVGMPRKRVGMRRSRSQTYLPGSQT
jgi:hypothetical protein